MEKELNPNLFGSGATQSKEQTAFYDPTSNYRGTERAVDRAEIKRVDQQFLQLQDRVQEFIKTSTLKNEKMVQRLGHLDQKLDGLVQEVRTKYATLAGKVTERNLMESEVQALLERHNNIVRSFETRMSQMQKLIENQQLQLMNANALIEEGRREITRLKRI